MKEATEMTGTFWPPAGEHYAPSALDGWVGAPLKDGDGNVIGVITAVSLDGEAIRFSARIPLPLFVKNFKP